MAEVPLLMHCHQHCS